MMLRTYVAAAAAAAVGLIATRAIVACSEISPPSFGNPNTLDRKSIPGEGGATELICGADGGGEGGSGDGGCPSFATDIFPYFQAAGAWRCADQTCHGGTSAPPIDDTSAAACLASLQAIKVTTMPNAPYVPSDGGTNINASSLLCNLQGSCGSKMPKPPGNDPTEEELCKVQAWLSCGSPP